MGEPTPSPARRTRWVDRASRPVSGASLAAFRILFGAVAILSAVRILAYGWIDSLYSGPARHFTYPGLHGVAPPSGWGMTALVVVVGVAGGTVALGWRYRLSMVVLWLSFGWLEAIDVTTYLNHYWFMTAVGAVMVAAPLAGTWSLDARRRRRHDRGGSSGAARAASVPVAWVWLFRAQVGVVYAFAGLAKLQPTWLVEGRPLRLWLPVHADVAVVGPLLAQPSTAVALSWAGAAFDCAIVPLLLWRRTRLLAWLTAIVFHTVTGLLFPIGVFPLLMVGAALVFFEPDWPLRLLARARRRYGAGAGADADAGADPVVASDRGGVGGASDPTVAPAARRLPPWLVAGMVLVVVLHVLVPLRHLAYPGDARWTGEGYRFSWNVLLNEKSGSVEFLVLDRATGRRSRTDASSLYTPLQLRVMATEPELIRQAAHAVAEDAASRGADVEVRVEAFLSLNGGPAQRLIDPSVDLAREPGRLTPQPWILPAP